MHVNISEASAPGAISKVTTSSLPRLWSGTSQERAIALTLIALLRQSDEEVLWYDNLRETWFLLERRAYLTRSQSGGIVYSEAPADEVVRRALVLEPYIDRNFWISITPDEVRPYPLTQEILSEICLDPELGFIVSEDQIGSQVASLEWPEPGKQIHLYRCADFRKGG